MFVVDETRERSKLLSNASMVNVARTEYWTALCRACGGHIYFVEVRYDPISGDRINPKPVPDPFEEDCPHCEFPNLYSAEELVPIEGLATLSFIAHEAFASYCHD